MDEYKSKWKRFFQYAIQSEIPFDMEAKILQNTGSCIWIRLKGQSEFKNGECVRVYGTIQNVDKEINTQLELEQNKKKYETIVQAIPDIIFRFNKNSEFTYCQSKDPSKLFFKPSEFIGRKINEFFPPEISNLVEEKIKSSLENNSIEVYEYSLNMSKGILYEEAQMVKYNDDKVSCIIRVITDRKLAEIELKKTKE